MLGENDLVLNDWHVVSTLEVLAPGESRETMLMGEPVYVRRVLGGTSSVTAKFTGRNLPVQVRYGHVWTGLGTPDRDIINIPEALEDDRIITTGGSIGVKSSGLRVVENFLDLGHLAFVHPGWLGEEPHTEVRPYNVILTVDNEILATEVSVYQPSASPTAQQGIMVDYVYRVYRPYMVALYKTNPTFEERQDYVVLFIQPATEETCIVHPYLCYIDDGMGAAKLRWFMQLIFGQDKPILENQQPRRLPLSPRAETPIRADQTAIIYRRWLHEHNVSYGAIPAANKEHFHAL